MSLLNRIATVHGNKKRQKSATKLRNQLDAGKHKGFNNQMTNEIAQKQRAYDRAVKGPIDRALR